MSLFFDKQVANAHSPSAHSSQMPPYHSINTSATFAASTLYLLCLVCLLPRFWCRNNEPFTGKGARRKTLWYVRATLSDPASDAQQARNDVWSIKLSSAWYLVRHKIAVFGEHQKHSAGAKVEDKKPACRGRRQISMKPLVDAPNARSTQPWNLSGQPLSGSIAELCQGELHVPKDLSYRNQL